MPFEIVEESPAALEDYASVPISFLVQQRFRVDCPLGGLGGLLLTREAVQPFRKDYDARNGGPAGWLARWNTSHWGVLVAYDRKVRVGGAVLAWKTEELVITGNRAETVVLWDLRVAPSYRRQGAGRQLFARALEWGRARSCTRLEVETQNINVAACEFYARQGCELASIDRQAYGTEFDEVRLVWEKAIEPRV